MWYILTMEYYSVIQKNGLMKLEWTWKHYAKWEKPDTEDYILYNPVYMEFPEKANYGEGKQTSACLSLGWSCELTPDRCKGTQWCHENVLI